MRSAHPLLVKARAQGLLIAGASAGAAVATGWACGGEQVGVPGLVDPIPAVRTFPAVLGAIGALVLLEPWRGFEQVGVHGLPRHRTNRFWLGFAVVAVPGVVLSATAGSRAIGLLAVVVFVALAVLIGLVGPFWWAAVAVALYGQFFLQEFDELRPEPAWVALAVLLAWPVYVARGESVAWRSGEQSGQWGKEADR